MDVYVHVSLSVLIDVYLLLIRVGLELPTVEVRYRNLSVEVEYEVVHGKPLPTLWNTLKTAFGASIFPCFSLFSIS
jgi:hypothetical protein